MTIQEVIDNILAATACERLPETVDTLKTGDPAQPVTKVVSTFMASMDVLKKSVELGANFIITHEPTYYNHRDKTEHLVGDPVFEAKRRYIEEHGLAIWRYHDYCHRHKPDLINEGFARRMGWLRYRDPQDEEGYNLPPVTLRDLAAALKQRLGIAALRVAGDPAMMCRRVAETLGACGEASMEALRRKNADAVVAGEVPEWVTCEYVRDATTLGHKKALIVLGHAVSEQPGMDYFAQWLKERIPGLEVHAVATGEPHWMA